MKIHHIGYLVQEINNAINTLLKMGGIMVNPPIFDEIRLVDIAFIKNGNLLIELVSPRQNSNDIGDSLKKLKNIPYHLCFECNCIEITIDELVNNGCILVKEPQPAIAINGCNVAFLYSAVIGLFEIVEIKQMKETKRN